MAAPWRERFTFEYSDAMATKIKAEPLIQLLGSVAANRLGPLDRPALAFIVFDDQREKIEAYSAVPIGQIIFRHDTVSDRCGP